MSEDEMEQYIREAIATATRAGAMNRTGDLGSMLWCFVIELEDPTIAALAMRVGKRIYLEARARQVSPAPS